MRQRKVALMGIFLIALVVLGIVKVGGTQRTQTHAAMSYQESLQNLNLSAFVNPLIGTQPVSVPYFPKPVGGYTFPGADVPFGAVQFSPDTTSAPPGGYSYNDTKINGFSLTHLSGAGCSIYHDVPFMPYVGAINTSPDSNVSAYGSNFSHSGEVAHPGYYAVQLGSPSNVKAELAVTQRTGFGQFTY